MKVLKTILIILVALVALILLVAAFLPSSYHVERSTIINMPVDSAFIQVNDFNHYSAWNPWTAMDPDSKVKMSDPSYGVGSKWEWSGEIVGTGSITREQVVENKLIQSTLEFTAPRADVAKNEWHFEAIDSNSTKITWAMGGNLDYPVGRFLGLMMDGMIGGDFEQGLKNLKERTESM